MNYPVVAIVGRPNVGKSSLFNALLKRREAIISEIPGTTRDRVDAELILPHGGRCLLVDTAGIMELEVEGAERERIEKESQRQALYALEMADLIIFMVDVKEKDLLPTDHEAASYIRKSDKPYILVANKCDNKELEMHATMMYELGLGEPRTISVMHNRGLDDLLGDIVTKIEKVEPEVVVEEGPRDPRIVFVGTPNVGKSQLFNALLDQERAVVSNVAGTTRDSLETKMAGDRGDVTIIDTAGLRKRGKIEKGIETFSVLRTKRAIARADVCFLVLDAAKGVDKQDMHVAQEILAQNKGVVIVINKWDLIKDFSNLPQELQLANVRAATPKDQYFAYLRYKFPFMPWAPVVFISAKNKKNTDKVLPQVFDIVEARRTRIPTGELNTFISRVIIKHKPTGKGAHVPKISYVTQVGIHPPQIVLFVNDKSYFHFSYARYLENRLREKYNFVGTPIVIELRNKRKKDYSSSSES